MRRSGGKRPTSVSSAKSTVAPGRTLLTYSAVSACRSLYLEPMRSWRRERIQLHSKRVGAYRTVSCAEVSAPWTFTPYSRSRYSAIRGVAIREAFSPSPVGSDCRSFPMSHSTSFCVFHWSAYALPLEQAFRAFLVEAADPLVDGRVCHVV